MQEFLPDAPTLPGFCADGIRFPLSSSEITSQVFTFQTSSVSGLQYPFQGRFSREDVEDIKGVPYLPGVLVEMTDGRIISKRKMRFGHAVIQ